jgi:hypothetical protein
MGHTLRTVASSIESRDNLQGDNVIFISHVNINKNNGIVVLADHAMQSISFV